LWPNRTQGAAADVLAFDANDRPARRRCGALPVQGKSRLSRSPGGSFREKSSDGKGTAQLPHPATAGSKRPLRGAKANDSAAAAAADRGDGSRSDIPLIREQEDPLRRDAGIPPGPRT
jgi:hypothetical protein